MSKALLGIIFVLAAAVNAHRDSCRRLLLSGYEVLIIRLQLETLIVNLQRFVILLHQMVDSCFAKVSFDEGWVEVNAFVCVFESGCEVHDLDISLASIGQKLEALRITT